jgi:glycosyltransferase involved in cell wall biosynthesis
MHTPAIAVVIPVYNAGRFINESIDSVRAQTTSQWECMIVDDGSTDETPSRLAAYRDPRIRWIRRANIGDCAVRARGVSLTRAPKIVCLDADDRLYPDAPARCVSFLDKHIAAGVAYGERTLINEGGDPFGLEWRAVLNKHPQGDVLESILRCPFLSTPSRACLRREVVPRGVVRRPEPFGRLALACRRCDKPQIRLHRASPIGQISRASEQGDAEYCKRV